MVSDRIESYLISLVEETQRGNIKWRPILEFFNTSPDGFGQFYNYINIWCHQSEDGLSGDMNTNSSFFAKKDDYYLCLIDIEYNENNSITHDIQLVGSYIPLDSIITIPPYIDGGIHSIQDSICDYWSRRKSGYGEDAADIFDLLESFI